MDMSKFSLKKKERHCRDLNENISLCLIMSRTIYLNRISQWIASHFAQKDASEKRLLLPCMVFHALTCILVKR